MRRMIWLLGALWLCFSTLPAHAFPTHPEVENLWQDFQRLQGIALDQPDHALDPAHGQQYQALLEQLMALQVEFETGLRQLGPIERHQLEQMMHHPLALRASPAAIRSGTATVEGQVQDTGGVPVPEGRVSLRPFGRFPSTPFQALLGPDGHFVVSGVAPGLYVLQVDNMPTHVAQAWPDLPCFNGNYCRPELGGEILEILGDETLTRSFVVERGVRVGGSVLDADNNPVAGALVRITRRDGAAVFASTDAAGDFLAARALPPGRFRVSVEPIEVGGELQLGSLHDGQACRDDCGRLPVDYLSLANTAAPYMVDLQLQTGRRISGTVFDADGVTPLPGASVTAQTTDRLGRISVTTDAAGQYSFEALRPAAYQLIASHPARLAEIYASIDCFGIGCTVEAGQALDLGAAAEFTNIDFSLAAGAEVSGRVVRASDGSPVANAIVNVANSLQGGRFAQTDANGEYVVGGMVEGTFFVSAIPGSGDAELQRAHLGNVNCPVTFCEDFGQPLQVPSEGQLILPDIELSPGGGIAGQTIDGQTGVPTEGPFVSRLELWVAEGPFAGQLAAQAVTGLDGRYEARGLMPGAYKATFGTSSHLGLIDVGLGDQPCPRGSCDLGALAPVFITAGNVLADVDAVYPRGPVISGRVVDADTGEPLGSVPAIGPGRLIGFSDVSGRYASFSSLDGDGVFRSRTGFPAGTYYTATFTERNQFALGNNYIDQAYNGIDCPRLQCNLGALASGVLIADENIGGIDFSVRQGGRIRGRVLDAADNSPLQGIGIEAYDSAGRLVALDQTNALGDYELEALPSGSYTVRTRNLSGFFDQLFGGISCTPFCNPVVGTPVSVLEQAISAGIDFTLTRSVALSGTVTVEGLASGSISVEVYDALGSLVRQTLSEADGTWSVSGLAAGRFYLRTRNSSGYADVLYDGRPCTGNACRVRRGDPVDLEDVALAGLDMDLSPGAAISGRVLDRSDPTLALSGVRVQLLNELGVVVFETTSAGNGAFQFSALGAGDYHLVTRNTPLYIDQTLGGTPCPAACNGLNGERIELAAGANLSGQDLELSNGAEITGVVSASGVAAAGARVQVYDSNGVPVAQVQTNAAGAFVVGSLPDGQYFARAGNVAGHVSELWLALPCSGYCDILNGTPISILGGTAVTGIDFDLQPAGSLGGQVSGPGGAALAGVEVLVFDNAGFLAGSALTNALGAYLIGGLVDGAYRVRTANTAGLIDAVFGGSSCSPTPCELADGTELIIAGGPLSGIDFSLAFGSTLSGTATDPFGNPLPGGTAILLDASGAELLDAPINNGLWSFDGVANGTYFVLIRNTLGLVDRLYLDVDCPGGGCDIPALGTPITLPAPAGGSTIAAGRAAGLDIVLAPGDLISGRVVAQSAQQPLAGVKVFFYTQSGAFAGQAVTDALGEFESEAGLPAGVYFAATAGRQERGAGGNFINSLFDGTACPLSCDVTAGTAIGVGGAAGADASAVNFSLGTGAGIRGRIRGPDAEDLVQVDIRLYDAGGALAGTARSDSLGHYLIEGLPAGVYFAHTRNTRGLTDVAFGDQPCAGACAPTAGDEILVPASGFTDHIDFRLFRTDMIFGDRFD